MVGEATLIFQLLIASTIIAFLRNEIGIDTFGVFGPVIIAFAWIEMGIIWGLLLFFYIFLIAVTTRFILEPFDLGPAHRLATLVGMVGLGIIIIRFLGSMEYIPAFSLFVLFPVILISWYGERFTNQVIQVGWPQPSIRLLWTIVAITASFLVVSIDPFISWFSQTPEAWMVLIAINVFVGIGSEFRIMDYFRFDTLVKSLKSPKDKSEILNIRTRNREYIRKYNPKYLLGNFNKVKMKNLFSGTELPTPDTHMVVKKSRQLDELRKLIDEKEDLVIKPSNAFGGGGILLINGRENNKYNTSQGKMTEDEIIGHTKQIIQGQYSRGYLNKDAAIVEEMIHPEGVLRDYSGIGIPDLRVIIFKGYPVMAMTRLPTQESKGAANLHIGAIGVGISVSEGEAVGAYQQTKNRFLEEHPDTEKSLKDIKIPDWENILNLSVKAANLTQLGYAGVDIIFSQEKGPIVLEVNRFPGLGIQNANMRGLRKRLEFIEDLPLEYEFKPPKEKAKLARQWDREEWGDLLNDKQ